MYVEELLAVERPADERRVAEEEDGEGDEIAADAGIAALKAAATAAVLVWPDSQAPVSRIVSALKWTT